MENVPLSGDDPQKRFGHTVTMISKTKAILFGGAISSEGNYKITGDTFLYDCMTCSWKKIHPHYEEQRGPCPRAAHASTVVEELQMVVFGGAIGHGTLADDDLYLLKNVDNGPGTWVKVPVDSKDVFLLLFYHFFLLEKRRNFEECLIWILWGYWLIIGISLFPLLFVIL